MYLSRYIYFLKFELTCAVEKNNYFLKINYVIIYKVPFRNISCWCIRLVCVSNFIQNTHLIVTRGNECVYILCGAAVQASVFYFCQAEQFAWIRNIFRFSPIDRLLSESGTNTYFPKRFARCVPPFTFTVWNNLLSSLGFYMGQNFADQF